MLLYIFIFKRFWFMLCKVILTQINFNFGIIIIIFIYNCCLFQWFDILFKFHEIIICVN